MILHCEDQIVLDVQFHLQVDEPYASGQAWMPFLLNTQTFFSVLVMLVVTKLGVFRSMKIRRLQIQIQVDKNPGKAKLQFCEFEIQTACELICCMHTRCHLHGDDRKSCNKNSFDTVCNYS